MRGICCVGLVVAVMVATAPDASAQERGDLTDKKSTTAKPKKKHSKPKASLSYVEIEVRSDPRGATVLVDGERVGKTPVKVKVPTGRRTIEARMGGYVNGKTSVDVSSKMGYVVFSLGREAPAPKVADKPEKRRSKPGFGASNLSYDQAIAKARLSLKRGEHADALKYAEAALSHKSSDSEALMIATIAACGVGDKSTAKQHLPRGRGSYREIAIKRCDGLGIQLP